MGLVLKFTDSELIMYIMMLIKSWAVWLEEVMAKLRSRLLIKMTMTLLKRREAMGLILMWFKKDRKKHLLDRLLLKKKY